MALINRRRPYLPHFWDGKVRRLIGQASISYSDGYTERKRLSLNRIYPGQAKAWHYTLEDYQLSRSDQVLSQQEYHTILAVADKAADSTAFVEFMLRLIRDALNDLMQIEQVREQVTDQVERLMSALGSETLSAKELLEQLGLSTVQRSATFS
ncbi:hypothetical protein [Desulfosporosinus youngiae]|uniref:Uncharacterized protein n=1 Tax=Desulfosporosinus youngiae DSM 17734 TaxID=768710 RepID=H5Y4J4_9FIRM|nr:hypothetical protein [Desulfosporosinus youngiae]EHQ89592.1 hypothetical protein DesyoDRAFT_2523 [Desulfosporosinus youngiae DSM 17734]